MLKKANLFVFFPKITFPSRFHITYTANYMSTFENYEELFKVIPHLCILRKEKSELNLLVKKWSIINHGYM